MERLAAVAGMEVVWNRPRGGVFTVAATTVQIALSNIIGRRPFSDMLIWGFYPWMSLARLMDRWHGRPNIITLGWQMLAKKPMGNK